MRNVRQDATPGTFLVRLSTKRSVQSFLRAAVAAFVAPFKSAGALVLIAALPLSNDVVADNSEESLTAANLIEFLGLEGHVEGGYFRRTFEAEDQPGVSVEPSDPVEPILKAGGEAGAKDSGDRFSMTSIYYLLTAEGPVGHFHKNRSDIVHYFHLGDPIDYFLIHPDGSLEQVTMGPDPRKGHRLQLTVSGGIWKASRLRPGGHGYGLISEAVTPGFDYRDMTLGTTSQLSAAFPDHVSVIAQLSRDGAANAVD